MEIENFLIAIVNGEKRKLLKRKDRPKRRFSQVTAYLGDGFGEDKRLGAYKYSIHSPRPGAEEHLIHFRALKPDAVEDCFEHRHYTRALTCYNRFAHVFSARYQTLGARHNGIGERGRVIQLLEEFSQENSVLTVGVYVGNKDIPFEVPAGEHVRMVRIETASSSFIILYMLEKNHKSLRFSQIITTATLSKDRVKNPVELKIYEKINMGCTPEFSVNQFVMHHFDLFRDYWRTWVKEVETLHAAGQIKAHIVEEFRFLATQRLRGIDMDETKRNREGKVGRYL